MRRVSRRHFITTSSVVGAVPIVGRLSAREAEQRASSVFRHGVASGDPLGDRVILWTRVSVGPADSAEVSWTMARDRTMRQVVARGTTRTGAARDFTVKVDVSGLDPGTTYYYRFDTSGEPSPVGRTRTLPSSGVERVRLAVVSCSNLPFGYFNAYRRIAERPDLDAVVHLGDYLYEYRNGQYGDGSPLDRVPMPDKEIVALEDYRQRHAQYKLDSDLQEVHRQHPFIVVWDDHELTNNTWWNGAQNHQPEDEGLWMPRRNAAVRAYFEWMPIREDAQARSPRIYRTLSFGTLADLVLLDTRLVGRDEQAASREDIAVIEAPTRSILGMAQEHWLAGELTESKRAGVTWQVLGQQVMFAPTSEPGARSSNPDSWDGYRACRSRVFDMIEELKLANVAVLTGDVHSSWVYDLPRRPFDAYDKATGRGSLGVEIVGTSITSPSNLGAGPTGEQQLADMRARSPHLHYVDGRYRGYAIVDLTRERLQADYFYVASVLDRTKVERFAKGFVTRTGLMHMVETTSPAPPAPAPDPAP